MTVTERLQSRRERRSMMTSYPNGWGFVDPTAVPPPGNFQAQRAGVLVTPHTSLQIGAVHRCIEVIVNAILSAGNAMAFRYGVDKDNLPYKMWFNPQPSILTSTFGDITQSEGLTQTVTSLALFGEAFWWITQRNFYQFPSVITPLNPMMMSIKVDEEGQTHFFYGTGKNRVELAAEDIMHMKGLTMPGANRALSPIEYEGPSFALALAAVDFGSKWFAQGASPGYLLSTDQRIGKDEIKRIAEQFLVEHSGLQAAHLPLVLDSGMHAEKLGATADEAGFIGTLEYARQEIAGFFGIPAHLIGSTGDTGGVWGKGLQEQNLQMVSYTLQGYLTRLNEAFTNCLPRGQFAELNIAALTRADSSDRAKEVQQLRLGTIMTPNEIRRDYYDMAPVAKGDDIQTPLATVPEPAPAAASTSSTSTTSDTDDDSSSGSSDDSSGSAS